MPLYWPGMATAKRETEIKLVVANLAAVRQRLRELGFRIRHSRSFEENTLWDSKARVLQRRRCMLRLRSAGGRHWLTFKGPAGRSSRFKIRQEFETELADAEAAGTILAELGLVPVFRYEKYRTVYLGRGSWAGGEVLVDETPIGYFVELEGSRAWIRRLARALGATEQEFITRDYTALYAEWCRRRRRPVQHMVFRRRRRVSA